MGSGKELPFALNQKQLNRLVFGGIAGSIAKTAIAPLERIRIIAQTASTTNTNLNSSYYTTIRTIVREEGIQGLWRGNLIACIRAAPSKAVLFATNDFYKQLLMNITSTISIPSSDKKRSLFVSFFGGSFAGMTAAIITYPLDTVRIRVTSTMFTKDSPLSISNSITSKRVTTTFWNIIKYEGFFSGLYKGITPTIIGAIPYEGIKFLSFDVYKQIILKYFDVDVNNKHGKVLSKVAAGALAGATAGIALYPNDTVRKNMQMESVGVKGANISMIKTCRRLYREGGISRFFKGISPYILRVAPNSAIQFGVYEALKTWTES